MENASLSQAVRAASVSRSPSALLAKGAKVAITGRRATVVSSAGRGTAQGRRSGHRDCRGCRHGGRADRDLAACARCPRRARYPGQQRRWRSRRTAGGHDGGRDRGDADRGSPGADPADAGGLPSLRASGDAMVVNVTSGIALIGAPCQRKTVMRPRERHSPIS